jgi:hypothetical protein
MAPLMFEFKVNDYIIMNVFKNFMNVDGFPSGHPHFHHVGPSLFKNLVIKMVVTL